MSHSNEDAPNDEAGRKHADAASGQRRRAGADEPTHDDASRARKDAEREKDKADDALDEALKETFPASDPVSIPKPKR